MNLKCFSKKEYGQPQWMTISADLQEVRRETLADLTIQERNKLCGTYPINPETL
jgi:hypothetical protein